MNVYDFDGTLFHPDCSYLFFVYCLRHDTRAVSNAIPKSLLQFLRYWIRGRKDAKPLKEALFSYLNRLESTEQTVQDFWAENADKVESWYLQQRDTDDLILSASPEFLLQPIAEKLGVRLLATPMNPYTGKIEGRNCHDIEKVRRFREAYPGETVEAFYSDSLSDSPMAELADRAYLVRGSERIPWPTEHKKRAAF